MDVFSQVAPQASVQSWKATINIWPLSIRTSPCWSPWDASWTQRRFPPAAGFFVVWLFGCFPGAAITHLPSDRLNQISVLRFCFGCYNILCSDWSVRQCSGKASFREPWVGFHAGSSEVGLGWDGRRSANASLSAFKSATRNQTAGTESRSFNSLLSLGQL